MGEMADMIIDGALCQGCGVCLGGEPPGYPRSCSDCRADERKASGIDRHLARQAAHALHQARQKKTKCPICTRKVKEIGLANHMKDAHPEAKP